MQHTSPGATLAEAVMLTLGSRVRAARRQAGLNQRQLADRARVSDRYVGQLEKGQANVSVGVLVRVAQALGIAPDALFAADSPAPTHHPPLLKLLAGMTEGQQQRAYEILRRRLIFEHQALRGIALVGLRGAGKSTLGAAVAARLNVPFVRLSSVVEEIAGMRIGELMGLRGEKAYRRFESEALEQVIARYPTSVLETAGGIVMNNDAYELLLARYRVVWLRTSPEEHMQRVLAQGDLRPMAGNEQAMEDLRAILTEREPAYSRADSVLDTSGRAPQDSMAELIRIAEPVLRCEPPAAIEAR